MLHRSQPQTTHHAAPLAPQSPPMPKTHTSRAYWIATCMAAQPHSRWYLIPANVKACVYAWLHRTPPFIFRMFSTTRCGSARAAPVLQQACTSRGTSNMHGSRSGASPLVTEQTASLKLRLKAGGSGCALKLRFRLSPQSRRGCPTLRCGGGACRCRWTCTTQGHRLSHQQRRCMRNHSYAGHVCAVAQCIHT